MRFRGYVYVVDQVLQVVIENVGIDDAGVLWKAEFHISFIAPGLFLAQICVSFKGILIIVTGIGVCGKVTETKLSDIFFDTGTELYTGSDIESVINFWPEKIEVSCLGNIAFLGNFAVLEQQCSFQGHTIIHLPVVNSEVLIAHFFDCAAGIGDGGQTAKS